MGSRVSFASYDIDCIVKCPHLAPPPPTHIFVLLEDTLARRKGSSEDISMVHRDTVLFYAYRSW